MKKYKISNLGIDNTISLINNKSKNDKYYQPQINILDANKMRYFLEFCEKLSMYSYVDELGGIPPNHKKSDFVRRYRIDKELKDIIHNAHTSIVCGLKIVKNPLSRISYWEEWKDGYIEVFARMDGDKKGVDWFSWQYIRISNLKIILEKFKNDLTLL